MYAHVYPILRLPRRFGVFDYRIPENVDVKIGDIVAVPFHNRTIHALVTEVDETTNVMSDIRDIASVAFAGACTAGDVDRFAYIATSIAQSPSTIMYHAIGELLGETGMPAWQYARSSPVQISRDAAEVLAAAFNELKTAPSVALQLSPEAALAMAKVLRERSDKQLLIIVPRERDADIAVQTVQFGEHAAVLHGRTKPKERERILRAWRNGTARTLVGTRQAALLPAKELGHVIVLTSGTEDHFNDRKNPRLDSRLLAEYQAKQHNAKLLICDVLPRPEEMAAMTVSCQEKPAECTVVSLRQPEEQTDYALLSESLIQAAKTALQSGKNLLFFYNRKGVARRAQCRNCGHIPVCAVCQSVPSVDDDRNLACVRCGNRSTVPTHCPACEHGKVGLKGIGNAHIEKDLAELFPGVSIARIEKGHAEGLDARILLVTEYYFTSILRPFAAKRFGLVADLSLDLSLTPDNFRGTENAARKLHRLAYVAKQQGAVCIAQTWLPDIIEPMRNAKQFLQNEFEQRMAYGLPPATALITVRHTDPEVLSKLTGQPFIPVQEILGCQGRVPLNDLPDILQRLQTLPDTCVISIDRSYESYRSALPRSETP